jgi:hypothetical protein
MHDAVQYFPRTSREISDQITILGSLFLALLLQTHGHRLWTRQVSVGLVFTSLLANGSLISAQAHLLFPNHIVFLDKFCSLNELVTNDKHRQAGCWWLVSIILATCEVEVGRIKAQGQHRQILCETPISKITRAKWTGGMA